MESETECLQLFHDLLQRDFNPLKNIVVKVVNDQDVLNSPYLKALKKFGFEKNYDGLTLWRKL